MGLPAVSGALSTVDKPHFGSGAFTGDRGMHKPPRQLKIQGRIDPGRSLTPESGLSPKVTKLSPLLPHGSPRGRGGAWMRQHPRTKTRHVARFRGTLTWAAAESRPGACATSILVAPLPAVTPSPIRKRPRVLLVLQHNDHVPPGLLDAACAARAVRIEMVQLHRGGLLPPVAELASQACGVAVLGGTMCANDIHVSPPAPPSTPPDFPFLAAEKDFLRHCLQRQIPVLGLCLGAQLLAATGGSPVLRMPTAEVGFPDIQLSADMAADPIGKVLGPAMQAYLSNQPFLSFHQDTFQLPAGATLLASSPLTPQLFRLGTGLGVQFHPEATPSVFHHSHNTISQCLKNVL
eukprot:gene11454-2085_t